MSASRLNILNPSFLVMKSAGGFKLVTASLTWTDTASHNLPDVDSTLRNIAKWEYIVVTEVTNVFYQVPYLTRRSMKYRFVESVCMPGLL